MKTTNSQITVALRRLWLRSKERSETLKQHKYTCAKCGKKQSKKKGQEVKINVHHKKGINNWEKMIEVIREELLCSTEELEVLCVDCHEH